MYFEKKSVKKESKYFFVDSNKIKPFEKKKSIKYLDFQIWKMFDLSNNTENNTINNITPTYKILKSR